MQKRWLQTILCNQRFCVALYLFFQLVDNCFKYFQHVVAILFIDFTHVGNLNHVLFAIIAFADIERIAAFSHFSQERRRIYASRQEYGGNRVGQVILQEETAA